jgi:hypothetical protein
LAAQELVNRRRSFTLEAIKIIDDPVAERPFRANLSGLAFDILMRL